jgi:hypothetical protein
VDRRNDNATSVDVEIDPHRRRLGRSQTDFALQAIVECPGRGESETNRSVLMRPQPDRLLGRSQTDFALQAIVECPGRGESETNRSVFFF